VSQFLNDGPILEYRQTEESEATIYRLLYIGTDVVEIPGGSLEQASSWVAVTCFFAVNTETGCIEKLDPGSGKLFYAHENWKKELKSQKK